MMLRLQSLQERLRLSLWFVPLVMALGAAALALGLSALDQALATRRPELFFAFGGSPEGARSVLSTIAQSMLTFTGLVFTITMLVLQLASSQLSPRVMRTFLRDRGNQVVLGMFVATFVFTLLVLREVRTPTSGGDAFVPAVSVWVAFVFLLASVAAFVWYIDHMAHAIRASTVISNIWSETVEAIERRYPEREGAALEAPRPAAPRDAPRVVLKALRAGTLLGVDEDGLRALTDDGDRVVAVVPCVGDFIAEGAPLARLWGDSWNEEDGDRVRGAIEIGDERTLQQDPGFGFRQLVDIALRALSPGTNDPTTAVQALDRIHDLLRRLIRRDLGSPVGVPGGPARVIVPRPSWDDVVVLALEEIRIAGRDQVQVVRRIHALLDDLEQIAPPRRRAALAAQRRRLAGEEAA
jgi:uncharacterized membrane protein